MTQIQTLSASFNTEYFSVGLPTGFFGALPPGVKMLKVYVSQQNRLIWLPCKIHVRPETVGAVAVSLLCPCCGYVTITQVCKSNLWDRFVFIKKLIYVNTVLF